MANPAPCSGLILGRDLLDRFMPMHLALSSDGRITSCGPTLRKIGPDRDWMGEDFFSVFTLRRPSGVETMADLRLRTGQRIHAGFRDGGAGGLRGLSMPLPDGQGLLINLSFGVSVIDAVRRYRLTEGDFAATDLAVEMLYMFEVKTNLTEDLRRMNQSLYGAKVVAEEQAQTDPLTGLRNRRALNSTLAALVAGDLPFALMHLDLDYFKTVNDTLGHAAGDEVLQYVARVLTDELRSNDTISRVGGDEFVLILPGLAPASKLDAIAQRIIERLSNPLRIAGADCQISASIGMVMSDQYPAPDVERILSDADNALYAAKRSGRGKARLHQPPPPVIGRQ